MTLSRWYLTSYNRNRSDSELIAVLCYEFLTTLTRCRNLNYGLLIRQTNGSPLFRKRGVFFGISTVLTFSRFLNIRQIAKSLFFNSLPCIIRIFHKLWDFIVYLYRKVSTYGPATGSINHLWPNHHRIQIPLVCISSESHRFPLKESERILSMKVKFLV